MLFTALCLCAPNAFAESGNYRIEILVFRHINNATAPVETAQLRSYFEFAELQKLLPAPAPVRMDTQSSAMEDIWRKLRLSSGFQPLLFAAWEQTRIDYHPPVRIHDEEVVAEAPYFPFPPAPGKPETGEPVLVFTDLLNPQDPAEVSAAAPEDYISSYFRLDGTAQLTRSRFLHLKLDLEYREALISTPLQFEAIRDTATTTGALPEIAVGATPGPAMIYALRQSRPVSTGETQYFDSPFLGVIARVTATSGE